MTHCKAVSYWTKRRRIQAEYQEFLESIDENARGSTVFRPTSVNTSTGTRVSTSKPKPVDVFDEESIINETVSVSPGLLEHVLADTSRNESINAGRSDCEFYGEDSDCSDSNRSSSISDDADSSVSEPNTASEDSSQNMCEKLAKWSTEYKVSHAVFSSLLSILRGCIPNLSRDSRTLLSTPTVTNTKLIVVGEYYHFGIESGIISKFMQYSAFATKVPGKSVSITLQINIDGLPIAKSTTGQFWPVLGLIVQLPKKGPIYNRFILW